MDSETPLFRKAALDHLSSPEQLDQLMRVTGPRAWLALVALVAVVLAAGVWSVTGTIPTKVVGQGILIRTGGVAQIVSLSGGRVTDLDVAGGDVIHHGQILGRVAPLALADQLDRARAALAEARRREAVAPSETAASQAHVDALERDLAALEDQVKAASAVVSDRDGRVVEVTAAPGQVVAAGGTLLSVEPLHGPLEALIYLHPSEGKQVKVGMQVRLSPSTVQPEEYGYVIGRVRSISSFPATAPGMMRVLGNQSLVTSLSAAGAPFEVYADLDVNPATPSRYRWSSGSGPETELFSGTLCVGLVTVRTQRPLSLVIPYVRSTLGL